MKVKPIDNFPPNTKCKLCLSNETEVCLGPIYKLRTIHVHYFCLLLSKGIKQNGRDNQGILGFLSNDIKEEAERGEKEICSYCKTKGATIVCSHRSCPIKFHLPCGTKKGSMHLFFNHFPSYCRKHRIIQEIPPDQIKKLKLLTKLECPICSEDINLSDKTTFIWPSCCKSIPFHRICIQKYANEAGLYHFKCSLCQDRDKFKKLCLDLGIFIPERDASWELEPRAFESLCQVYYCNAEDCKCPKGRKYNHSRTKWANIKCTFCHCTGTHLGCSSEEISDPDSWICNICEDLSDRFKSSTCSEKEKFEVVKRKKTRILMPSTSIVKNLEKSGESSSSAGATLNDFCDRIPKVVLSRIEISPSEPIPGTSNSFINSPASSSDKTRSPSPNLCPDSPSGLASPTSSRDITRPPSPNLCIDSPSGSQISEDKASLNTNGEEFEDRLASVINKEDCKSSSKNDEDVPVEIINLDSDEESTPTIPSETKGLSSISSPSSPPTSSDAFAHQLEGTKETFLVYRSEIILSSESDEDCKIIETNLPEKTDQKKRKLIKHARSSLAPPEKKISTVSSDSGELRIIGFSLNDTLEASSSNSENAKYANASQAVSSKLEEQPSKIQVVHHQSITEQLNKSNQKFLQDIKRSQHPKSKPSAAIKPMCFEADSENKREPTSLEPSLKKSKLDLQEDGMRSPKVFHSRYFSKKIRQRRIRVYLDEMEEYFLSRESSEVFNDYLNSIVYGSSIYVIYDTAGKKYCQILSQNYKALPIHCESKPVTFNSKIFSRLRNQPREPSTVFLIAADISNISDDYIDLIESLKNGRFNYKIVVTTLPKIEKTSTFNFKLRLTNNFNRYLIDMCHKNSIDLWDLNKIDFF